MYLLARIMSIIVILTSILAATAARPALSRAAEPNPYELHATAWCDTGVLITNMVWVPNLGTLRFNTNAITALKRDGARKCLVSLEGKQALFSFYTPDPVTFSDGRKIQPGGYLTTESVMQFSLPVGDYSTFLIQVISAGDTLVLAERTVPLEGAVYFPETGHNLDKPFRDYWQTHGGLAQFGYPLTEAFHQDLGEGLFLVQYFERGRLEWHPEFNGTVYEIQLGQFGRVIAQGRVVNMSPAAPAKDHTCAYFKETSHNLCGSFADYWLSHGGLSQFGYPLTEEFTERLEDGNTYTVQYFERARFEYHPENKAPYDVLLGQFGRPVLAAVQATRTQTAR